jgi:hypothetical protein
MSIEADRLAKMWQAVTREEVTRLRQVLAEFVDRGSRRNICEDAGVHEHDLRNFLSGKSNRPKFRAGLRLLAYVAVRPDDDLDRGTRASVRALRKAMQRVTVFDPDEDYLFKHTRRLKLVDASACERIAAQIQGQYYMYRLSPTKEQVLRSHLELERYNPYNRLPHFVNRLKFGPIDAKGAPFRRSEGQVIPVGDYYLFVGFVFDSFKKATITEYKGVKLLVIPAAALHQDAHKPIGGIFVSFSYGRGDRYEYGPTYLMKCGEPFSEANVGEFPISRLSELGMGLKESDLKLDISTLLDGTGLLAACLTLSSAITPSA